LGPIEGRAPVLAFSFSWSLWLLLSVLCLPPSSSSLAFQSFHLACPGKSHRSVFLVVLTATKEWRQPRGVSIALEPQAVCILKAKVVALFWLLGAEFSLLSIPAERVRVSTIVVLFPDDFNKGCNIVFETVELEWFSSQVKAPELQVHTHILTAVFVFVFSLVKHFGIRCYFFLQVLFH
jgi:hypothetical protein